MKFKDFLRKMVSPDGGDQSGLQWVWASPPSAWLKYCSDCGSHMVWKEIPGGWNGTTGVLRRQVIALCPVSVDLPSHSQHLWHNSVVGYKEFR